MAKPKIIDDGATTKPSLGRPRQSSVKDHWISFRVTAEEYFLLLDKANRSSMSPGEYARSRAMRGVARKKKAPPAPEELFGTSTRALLGELRKQGVNLNQIAHLCHRHQLPPPVGLAELITELQALWRKVIR
ncbi:MAG: MobC family plasmid mobilization relaxosome protein [Hyphomicrobiales bacterium]|nr:MAG: MobC family plasmid mobilization relaxosome protein [Hyphomicrobiales bacterium]